MNRKLLVLLWSVMLLALPVFAQTGNQGSIEGTVTDPSGAVIASATVTANNVDTGASFTATTDENGLFRFPVLPVGNYEITTSHSGFANVTTKGVRLQVGARLTFPVTLKVASETTALDVTGELPVVETTRSQVSNIVDDKSVANLPTNGRNFIDFVLLTPGVTRDVRGGDISFAGQRGTLNSLVIDGADNNNTFFGQTTGRTGSGRAPYQFSNDAVQEFQVNSNGYSAELGHAGGAVINVVTKSGTNNFHGSAFEYYRDRSMNANDPINKLNGRAKSPYHFNQFGGTLGGPIKKDKLFFFFDYDGQRNTLPNLVVFTNPLKTVPTANQQRALDYLSARADSWNRLFNQNVYLGKVDWNINSKNILTGRYNRQTFQGGNLENSGNQNSFEHTGASQVVTDTAAVNLTTTLSNSMINVARYSHQRDHEPGLANSLNPEAQVREAGQAVLTVGRNSFSPRETTINRDAWNDTLSYVHGKHTFKFGGDFVDDRILNFFPGNFFGAYIFGSLESFGAALGGTPAYTAADSYTQAFAGANTTGGTTHPDLFDMAGFAQDEWRVKRNLTLNLGLRYEFTKIAQPSVTNPTALAAGINTGVIPEDKNNFAPRFGFAYTPFNNEHTVIRGGYGVFYARTPSILVGTAHSNNGLNVQTITLTGAQIPNTLTYPNTLCGQPTETPSCAPPTGAASAVPSIFFFDPNYRTPYVQQWNLGVEHQLGKDFSVAISYLGVKGTKIQRTRDINTPSLLLATSNPTNDGQTFSYLKYTGLRPDTNFQRIGMFESEAGSNYNGLTVQVNKRFSRNFQFTTAYTWSKAIDDMPDGTAVVPFSSGDDAKMVQYPSLASLDRALSVNDQRHRFVASGIWNLNYANGFTGVPHAILSGWELSGIFTAQSGQPYSAIVGSDINNDSNRQTDRVPGTGRDTFTLPSNYSLDPRLTRTVNLTERARMMFIWEAFNVLNSQNINGVRNTEYALVNGTFIKQQAGLIANPLNAFQVPTSSIGPRIMQLAVKFVF